MTYQPAAAELGSGSTWASSRPTPAITGGIFEFGFSDSDPADVRRLLRRAGPRQEMRQPFGCVTPQETALHHRVLTAALASHKTGQVVTP